MLNTVKSDFVFIVNKLIDKLGYDITDSKGDDILRIYQCIREGERYAVVCYTGENIITKEMQDEIMSIAYRNFIFILSMLF